MPLVPVKLQAKDARLAADFPGKLAAFRANGQEVVLRWVPIATRRLHPASDCYRGMGFEVRPLPLHLDSRGRRWGSFEASRGTEAVRVLERIEDANGLAFTDVSAWYWAAILGRSTGPWWVTTAVEEITKPG
jgi:hypothetical protein